MLIFRGYLSMNKLWTTSSGTYVLHSQVPTVTETFGPFTVLRLGIYSDRGRSGA